MLIGLIAVEKKSCIPCSSWSWRYDSKSVHILRHPAYDIKLIKLQAVAGYGPRAERIGKTGSVAIDRRSIHGDCYLYDYINK